MQHPEVDVIIIGGSYAGLSAAMGLGRALRQVAVFDSGQPCNQQAPQSHNLLTLDGVPPAQIRARALEQVLAYPSVQVYADTVVDVAGQDNAFVVATATGRRLTARKLVVATGVRDLLPAIPGLAACWGISVIHCPYCHGYEYRQQPTAILTNGPATLDFARLIRNWSPQLTVLTNGASALPPEHQQQLAALGISLDSRPLAQLIHEEGQLREVQFTEGPPLPLGVLYARVPFAQHFPLPPALPCALTEAGYLQTDEWGHTSVPGVLAAGDNRSMLRSVAGAIAQGSLVAGALTHALAAAGVYPSLATLAS